MKMGEAGAEPGPAVHFGQQRGDAHIRQHRVEPIRQFFGLLRRRRLERRDLQLPALDADVLQFVRRGLRGDFGEPPRQKRLPFGQVCRGRRWRHDRQRPGFAHRGEQWRRDQLVFHSAPLPAAFDPDVAGAQPVAQRQQRRCFPGAAFQLPRAPDRLAPGRPEEAGWRVAGPLSRAARIDFAQQLDRAERCGRGWNGSELECAEEQRAEPMEHWPGARGEGGQIGFVGTRQAFGFLDIARKLVPADRRGDRFVEVRAAIPRLDQRHAQLRQQPHLVVDGAGVPQQGVLLAHLGAAEHAADGAVEQRHAIIRQAGDGVEGGRDQGGAPAQCRQRPQMLRGEACPLAREFTETLGVDAFGPVRI
jgi:hypothetical protein